MFRGLAKSRMGVFTVALIALWVLKKLLLSPGIRSDFPWLGLVLDFATLLLTIPAVYYALKLSKTIRNRLLWKISRRLLLANVFIGAIPILLVIGIFWFAGLLFYYQLSYYLISNQIGIHIVQIHAANVSLREGLQELMTRDPAPGPEALQAKLDEYARHVLAAYPSASIVLSFPEQAPQYSFSYVNRNPDAGGKYEIPQWLAGRDFSGLVIDDLKGAGLSLRSLVYSDMQPDLPFNIDVSVPFDRYLLDRLKASFGQNLLLANQPGQPGTPLMPQDTAELRDKIVESTYTPETGVVWEMPLFPISWTTGEEISSGALLVELSTTALMRNLFRSESNVGARILGVLKTIVFFFLVVEVISIVIGILLTRSITNAVHNLDVGTEFVKRGDFSHRIVVRSQDQLGALAASFNQMTEYVQHLVKEMVQKERLERELEIAKEVQQRLFPNHAPQVGRMNLAGVCLPARTVSGDYYDYLPLGKHELGLAVGDICGKGISAALLMTNLQATLRSNVINLEEQELANGQKPASVLVERLNSQICGYTAENRFASFFYAVYDDVGQSLTYCNAGHNPPLFFSGRNVRKLMVGGTILGVFEDATFEQETLTMLPGDLLVAYTDGIVECTNEYGEEFGEDRLIQLVSDNRDLPADRIKDAIVRQVLSWAYAEERDDDMTLVIAKIVE